MAKRKIQPAQFGFGDLTAKLEDESAEHHHVAIAYANSLGVIEISGGFENYEIRENEWGEKRTTLLTLDDERFLSIVDDALSEKARDMCQCRVDLELFEDKWLAPVVKSDKGDYCAVPSFVARVDYPFRCEDEYENFRMAAIFARLCEDADCQNKEEPGGQSFENSVSWREFNDETAKKFGFCVVNWEKRILEYDEPDFDDVMSVHALSQRPERSKPSGEISSA